jgi:hypothetical protein
LSSGVIHISSVIKFIKNKEGEGNNVPVPKHHTMKICRDSEGNAPHILNLNSRWRWVVSFKLWPLLPPAPLYRRLDGLTTGWTWWGGKKPSDVPFSSSYNIIKT